MHVVRAAEAVVMPWRNGGGVTRQYVSHPGADPFEWRVSLAEVDRSGPFSAFPGIDRILVVLSGNGMVLHADGEAVRMHRLDTHRFAGEQHVHAELIDGATTDLNLFWQRGSFTADVHLAVLPCHVPAGAQSVVYVVEGRLILHGGIVLEAGDLVVFDDATQLDGDGTVVVFVLHQR
jgi:hypothetical protein